MSKEDQAKLKEHNKLRTEITKQKYPASKAEVVAHVKGIKADDKKWFEETLPDRTYGSSDEVMSALGWETAASAENGEKPAPAHSKSSKASSSAKHTTPAAVSRCEPERCGRPRGGQLQAARARGDRVDLVGALAGALAAACAVCSRRPSNHSQRHRPLARQQLVDPHRPLERRSTRSTGGRRRAAPRWSSSATTRASRSASCRRERCGSAT